MPDPNFVAETCTWNRVPISPAFPGDATQPPSVIDSFGFSAIANQRQTSSLA